VHIIAYLRGLKRPLVLFTVIIIMMSMSLNGHYRPSMLDYFLLSSGIVKECRCVTVLDDGEN